MHFILYKQETLISDANSELFASRMFINVGPGDDRLGESSKSQLSSAEF